MCEARYSLWQYLSINLAKSLARWSYSEVTLRSVSYKTVRLYESLL